ncbi:DNA-directed RNA polymerase subunit H [Candidatus Micrarchaeota archaeon]|nr:DNA-directed RNA polymerase subunit H [Candidatus Micrarchaeota archaeon]
MLDKEIILSHSLVPRHEVLAKEDADEVLKKYGITRDMLPKIYESDAVVKVIDAKKGDMLKITRRSPTAGESVYYRLVV